MLGWLGFCAVVGSVYMAAIGNYWQAVMLLASGLVAMFVEREVGQR